MTPKEPDLSRREFVQMSALLPFGAVLLEGCGGSGAVVGPPKSVWSNLAYLSPATVPTPVYVTRSGEYDATKWKGVDQANLRYTWEADDNFILWTDEGDRKKYVTKVNNLRIRSNTRSKFGDKPQLTVTVSVIDPATGILTDLEVMKRTMDVITFDSLTMYWTSENYPTQEQLLNRHYSFIRYHATSSFSSRLRVSKFEYGGFSCVVPDSAPEGFEVHFDGLNKTPTVPEPSVFGWLSVVGSLQVFGRLTVQRKQYNPFNGTFMSFVLVGELTFRNISGVTYTADVQIPFGYPNLYAWIA